MLFNKISYLLRFVSPAKGFLSKSQREICSSRAMQTLPSFIWAYMYAQISISWFELENGLTGAVLPASENKVFSA